MSLPRTRHSDCLSLPIHFCHVSLLERWAVICMHNAADLPARSPAPVCGPPRRSANGADASGALSVRETRRARWCQEEACPFSWVDRSTVVRRWGASHPIRRPHHRCYSLFFFYNSTTFWRSLVRLTSPWGPAKDKVSCSRDSVSGPRYKCNSDLSISATPIYHLLPALSSPCRLFSLFFAVPILPTNRHTDQGLDLLKDRYKAEKHTTSSKSPKSITTASFKQDASSDNISQTNKMTDSMPYPSSQAQLPRNDSFSADDLANAFKASASKPRNDLSLRIVADSDSSKIAPPPPSPHESRRSSFNKHSHQNGIRL